LKRLANINSNSIITLKELSEEESIKILSKINVVNTFYKINLNSDAILKIHKDIIDSIDNDNRELNLNKLILDFLYTFRLFLDHWETYLNRTFGESSNEFKKFKAATNKEFNDSFAYRFISKFRNYIQHCGIPAIKLTGKLLEKEQKQYALFLNKEELLTQYKEWGAKVKPDLVTQPDRFDLYPLLIDVTASIQRLHSIAINCTLNIEELLLASREIMTFEKFIKSSEYELAVIEYKEFYDSGSPKSLSINVFPFDIAQYLIKNIQLFGSK
jgi:hypothetical protein